MKKEKVDLDFSVVSLGKMEDYLTKNVSTPGKAKRKTFFATDTDEKVFEYGCYVGEVIRKNGHGLKWANTETDSPLNITLESPEGGTAMVMNKAFKRFYQGEEDNVLHFASIMLSNYLKFEGEIPDDFYDEEDKRIKEFGSSRVCAYSSNIESRGAIDWIGFQSGMWLFICHGDAPSQEGLLKVLFLDEVKQKHPDIADLLVEKEGLSLNRQEDGSYKEESENSALFMDNSTRASNPGKMKVSYLQYIKMNFMQSVELIGFLLATGYLMMKVHWAFGILFLGSALYNLWHWVTVSNKFKSGDVNPGKVVSVSPDLVAVSTNLTKYGGDFPALTIIETNLRKEDKEVGKIIPTVALYNDNPHDYPFWADFQPEPVAHGTSDRKQLEYLLSNFSNEDIQRISTHLRQLPETKPGLYKMDIESSGWVDYAHVDLNKRTGLEGPVEKEE